jgi:hypothetical protein
MKCQYDGEECTVCVARCSYWFEVSEAFKAKRPISLKDRKILVDRIRRQLPLFSALVRKWRAQDRVRTNYDN